MILVADCGDSFVHNLSPLLSSLGAEVITVPEDSVTEGQVASSDAVVLSPGPGHPHPNRSSWRIYDMCHNDIPTLGVCLGHQTICAYHGADIVRGQGPMHGKLVQIHHDGTSLFKGVPNDFEAVRYNSLCADRSTLSLNIDAVDSRGDVMAVSVPGHRVHGVQFHPESFLTEHGTTIIENFLREAGL